jgi:hypothetical protein
LSLSGSIKLKEEHKVYHILKQSYLVLFCTVNKLAFTGFQETLHSTLLPNLSNNLIEFLIEEYTMKLQYATYWSELVRRFG